jgi:hypothetical protein
MIKSGAVPSLFFTLATFASGAIAVADAPKPTAPAPFAPKSAVPSGAMAPKPMSMPGAAGAKAGGPAGATVAAAPAMPSMPTPSKELEAFMKAFEGSWKCETKFAAGSTGPGSPEAKGKSSVKIRKEFDGFSWHGEYKLDKADPMPAMSGVFQISYDPSTKQATFVSYDSMGAAMMGAGPISGDSVAFVEQGYMLGIKAKVRETMTKKSSKEIHHKVEVDQGKGFQPMAEDTCKK